MKPPRGLRSLTSTRLNVPPVEARAIDASAFALSDPLTDAAAATPDRALQLAPVYAAVRLLADSIASIPLQAYTRLPAGGRARVEGPIWLDRPTPGITVYDWLWECMSSALLSGNAVGLVGRRGSRVTGVQWVDPQRVSVLDPPRGMSLAGPVWLLDGRRVDREDLIHISAFKRPGITMGLSPLSAYASTIEGGLAAGDFARRFFRNGSIPSAVLESDQVVDPDTAVLMKQRFLEASSGRSLVVLGSGTTFKPISVSPEEGQFIETMQLTAAQIAHAFGIPPEMIGGSTGGSSVTYANVEQRALQFVTFTLRPWLTRLELAFTDLLPAGQYAKFNADVLIRADTLSRFNAHSRALNDGWRNPDEIRDIEDLAPLPDGQGQGYIRGTLYPKSEVVVEQ